MSFVDDPFHPGSTMYATGDPVRMHPINHSFTYLDRRNTQIKIHGLRVEVGEVEAVLKATITNAVVVKVDIGYKCLVAFLQPPSHDDDFYAAGGDSISAIHLASAAGLQLQVTNTIRNPTVRAMAQIAESAILNRAFDDDGIPLMNLTQMAPHHLTSLDLLMMQG